MTIIKALTLVDWASFVQTYSLSSLIRDLIILALIASSGIIYLKTRKKSQEQAEEEKIQTQKFYKDARNITIIILVAIDFIGILYLTKILLTNKFLIAYFSPTNLAFLLKTAPVGIKIILALFVSAILIISINLAAKKRGKTW